MDFDNLDWICVEDEYPDEDELVMMKCESSFVAELYAYDIGVWNGEAWINDDGCERNDVAEWAYPSDEMIERYNEYYSR